MSLTPLQKFIDLIEFDQRINRLEDSIAQFQQAAAEREQERETFRDALAAQEQHMLDMRKEVDAHERLMKEYNHEEQEKKKRLETASNQREYESMQHEIDRLKKKQHDLETMLLQAWNKFENAERAFLEKKKFSDTKIADLDVVIGDKMQEAEKLKSEVKELSKDRHGKEDGIPAEWLENYVGMRKQVNNPVVSLEKNSCSACYSMVSQQDMLDLKKNKLLQCKNCFRFLYLK